MGLFDSLSDGLKGALGQAEAAALPALISAVLAKTDMGNVQGLLDKLQQSGLGPQVASWLGNGKNLPITADQLRAALGNTQLQQLAASFGLPVDKVLASLAEHLPSVVDQLSPNGKLQEPK
jgi:uncharacterized protein YidB (DUF937 family)